MLIYSFEKKFIGIGEEYLRIFGFSDLAVIQKEHQDFADFFVKKPGYVHNFQHVHWIDFIDCAESLEESKVMIKINSKTFTANIAITTIYLSESPSSKSYIIRLNNLRQLSGDTGEEYLVDIADEVVVPTPAKVKKEIYTPPVVAPTVQNEAIPSIVRDEPVDEDFVSIVLDDYEDEIVPKVIKEQVTPKPIPEPTPPQTPSPKAEAQIVAETPFIPEDDNYIFDPMLASSELGLPIDLIEEFIEDFIAQSKEFKSELYESLHRGDLETLASLSHKLKGVAGNLRIENAYDKLCIINTSKETDVLKKNLDHFYYIVAQLAGEKPQTVATVQIEPEVQESENIEEKIDLDIPLDIDLDDDDFVLDFKDEEDASESESLNSDAVVVTYSKEVAAREIGLDIETFNELLSDYLSDAFKLIEEIRDAIEVGDNETGRKKALSLKRMSDSLYMKDLTSDLSSIINMSDRNSMMIAIDNLQAIVKQISK